MNESSEKITQILKDTGQSLAVSTYQAGEVVLLCSGSGGGGEALKSRSIEMEKPMGMALSKNRLSIGTGALVIDHYNMPGMAERVEPINELDSCYLPRDLHVTGNIDIHEMAFDQHDELWIVNTKMSCLCTLDKAHSVVPRWRPPFISAYDFSDRCHLNGLAMKEGEPTWVTALGVSDAAAGWRENKANGGMLMEISTGKMLCSGLSMPHSPRWHNDQLWVLESGAGRLLQVDPNTGETSIIAEMPGFCRGIDFIGDFAFIGLSQVRETALFAGLPLTQRYSERRCGIWVVDLKQKKVIAGLEFPKAIQEIFAVQVLPATNPTILTLSDPHVQTTYSIPDDAFSDIEPMSDAAKDMDEALEHFQQGELTLAATIWKKMIQIDANQSDARFFLGVVLSDLKQWDEAIETLKEVTKREPLHAQAHDSLAQTFNKVGNFDEALKHFDYAIKADQQFANAHINRARLLLKLGEYKLGWEAFEWRTTIDSYDPCKSQKPSWAGEDITSNTLLVYTENDVEEAVLFSRLLSIAAALCHKLSLACDDELNDLLLAVEGVSSIISIDDVHHEAHDYQCSISALAKILNITTKNIPDSVPYVVNPSQQALIQDTGAGERAEKLKIGIAWDEGIPELLTFNSPPKSASLSPQLKEKMQTLAFYGFSADLTKNNASKANGHADGFIKKEVKPENYADLCAALSKMDLLISTCPVISQLSAAMNIPTWFIVPYDEEHIWLSVKTSSPWYPKMLVYRESKAAGWALTLEKVHKALLDFKG